MSNDTTNKKKNYKVKNVTLLYEQWTITKADVSTPGLFLSHTC